MNSTYNPLKLRVTGAVVISAVLLIGIYNLILKDSLMIEDSQSVAGTTQNNETATESTAYPSSDPAVTTSNATTDSASSSSSNYKDGTYNATTSYSVPHNTNSITVAVTIKDDVITTVTTSNKYSDNESSHYIDSFESNISNSVVGKKIDAADVYRVGGASLTTQAFNSAIAKVITTAKQ